MARKKILDLPSASSVASTDYALIVDGAGTTRRAAASLVARAMDPRISNGTTGDQDDIPRGPVIALTDGINIRGIDATSVADGQIIYLLVPTLAIGITVLHQDANSAAANRIVCWTAAPVSLYENTFVPLIYDATAARWKFVKDGF